MQFDIKAGLPNREIHQLRATHSNSTKKLKAWLSQLSLLDGEKSSVSLCNLLSDVSRIVSQAHEIYEIMEIVIAPCEMVLEILEKNYSKSQFYMLAKNQSSVGAAQTLDFKIILCYKSLLAQDHVSETKYQISNEQRLMIAGKLFDAYSRLLLRWSNFYIPPPQGFWREVSGIYEIYESMDLHLQPIQHLCASNPNINSSATTESLYLSLLILGMLEPMRFDTQFLRKMHDFLKKIALEMRLKQNPDLDLKTLYCIDLDSDTVFMPSRFFKNSLKESRTNEKLPNLRGLSVIEQDLFKKLSLGSGLKPQILDDIYHRLSHEISRQDQRSQVRKKTSAWIGYNAVQMMCARHDVDQFEGLDEEICYSNIQEPQTPSGQDESHSVDVIIDDASQTGYKLSIPLNSARQTRYLKSLKPGELLVVSDPTSRENQSKVAIIRWIQFLHTDQKAISGVQILGEEIELIVIRTADDSMQQERQALSYQQRRHAKTQENHSPESSLVDCLASFSIEEGVKCKLRTDFQTFDALVVESNAAVGAFYYLKFQKK